MKKNSESQNYLLDRLADMRLFAGMSRELIAETVERIGEGVHSSHGRFAICGIL